jgi:hypothetical protein
MRKALLLSLQEKKEKQSRAILDIKPTERLEYLLHLIKLTNQFNRKIHIPVNTLTFVLTKK